MKFIMNYYYTAFVHYITSDSDSDGTIKWVEILKVGGGYFSQLNDNTERLCINGNCKSATYMIKNLRRGAKSQIHRYIEQLSLAYLHNKNGK